MSSVTLNGWEAVLLAFAEAIIVTWYFIPTIIRVASKRHLTDTPGLHKIHLSEIPTLGGIGIFGGFAFGFLLTISGYMEGVTYFTAALMILFFIGLKDDLITIKPYKKIIAQVFAAIIISAFANMRFTNFHGFFGISVIPDWLSYSATIFLVVIIINSLNLIDGIDGLAASIGIIAATTFGIWSFFSGDYAYAIMSAALTGTLVVFLTFNLSKGKNKIFMGDTGSMVIGFILAVLAIRFNEINAGNSTFHKLSSAPAVSISILIVPLFDTLRVIIIRLIRGQSPLLADNRHIHHLLLRAGCTHKQATLYISLANIFIIALGFLLDHIGIFWLSLVLFLLSVVFTIPVYILVSRKEQWNWKNYKWWEIGHGSKVSASKLILHAAEKN